MENYLLLIGLKEDNTIKMRFESNPVHKGDYFTYSVEIYNGEIKEKTDKKEINKEILKKINEYKEISKIIHPIFINKKMEIEELEYTEKTTIGLLPNWRYTKDKKVNYRTVLEIFFEDKKTNSRYIFHFDPKDKIHRIFLLLNEKRTDISHILSNDITEDIKKYFIEKSKYRLKIMYLENEYK